MSIATELAPAVASQNTVTSLVPIGGIAQVFRSGDAYKAVGESVSRTAHSELSTAFPRNGSFSSSAATLTINNGWRYAAYGNGVFVVVGVTNAGAVTGIMNYSNDGGKTWLESSIPVAAEILTGVVFNGTKFVAVDSNGKTYTSTNGGVWTAGVTIPAGVGFLFFGGGLFIAGASGTATAYTSSDAITWTARTLPSTSAWTAAGYGGGMFVMACGGGATTAASSPDGITWTARTIPAGSYLSFTYGKGLFVASGGSSGGVPRCATSPDGITWTARSIPMVSGEFVSSVFADGVFFGVANVANRVLVSYDGISWIVKVVVMGGFSGNNAAICSGEGKFFATPTGTAGILAYAEDLTTSDYLYLSGTAGQFVRVK